MKYSPAGLLMYIMLALSSAVSAQRFAVTPLVPATGLIHKEQLWNVILINTSPESQLCYLSLTITDKRTGQQIMSGAANGITVSTGSRQVRLNDLMPVAYTSGMVDIDVSDNGLIPPGNYQLCYQATNGKQVLGTSCVNVVVELMSPTQLVSPQHKSRLTTTNVSFSWLPPSPANLMKNVWYEYKLVKISEGQLPVEAVRDNLPVYTTASIRGTSMTYPAFAPALEKHQLYAWQITASNAATISKSDVWTFEISDASSQAVVSADTLNFFKLSSTDSYVGYASTKRFLKFEFIHYGTDSLLNMKIVDVTGGSRKEVSVNKDFWPAFTRGKNLITLDLRQAKSLKQKHLYQLELEDADHGIWRMLFEFLDK